MSGYLCEGGSESCGGPICLSILAGRRKSDLEGLNRLFNSVTPSIANRSAVSQTRRDAKKDSAEKDDIKPEDGATASHTELEDGVPRHEEEGESTLPGVAAKPPYDPHWSTGAPPKGLTDFIRKGWWSESNCYSALNNDSAPLGCYSGAFAASMRDCFMRPGKLYEWSFPLAYAPLVDSCLPARVEKPEVKKALDRVFNSEGIFSAPAASSGGNPVYAACWSTGSPLSCLVKNDLGAPIDNSKKISKFNDDFFLSSVFCQEPTFVIKGAPGVSDPKISKDSAASSVGDILGGVTAVACRVASAMPSQLASGICFLGTLARSKELATRLGKKNDSHQPVPDAVTSASEAYVTGHGSIGSFYDRGVNGKRENGESRERTSANDSRELSRESNGHGVGLEEQKWHKQKPLEVSWYSLDALERAKQPPPEQKEALRENGLGYFLDKSIETETEPLPFYPKSEKPQWEQITESYSNDKNKRAKNILKGWSLGLEEKRKYLKHKNGTSYNESASPREVPQYKETPRHAARVLDAQSNPEFKCLSKVAASAAGAPLELKAALGTVLQSIFDKSVKAVESVNSNNTEVDYLRSIPQIKGIVRCKKEYDKLKENNRQSALSEAEYGEMYDLGAKVTKGVSRIRLAEQRGRAVSLAQQVENVSRFGGNLDTFAPPVEGSRLKFKSTRLLNKAHSVLVDRALRASTKIASLSVFGKAGLKINEAVEYPIDKLDQFLLRAKKKINNYNDAVALHRSQEFHHRHYSDETTDQMLNWLSQEINSLSAESAGSSSAPSAHYDSDSPIIPLSPVGKKQGTPHVTP